MELDYMLEYQAFQDKFRLTEVSGEEIGELIMHLANYFSKYNVRMGDALRAISIVKAGFQNQVDELTGKTMSSAKAETLSDATPEAHKYEMSRIHVTNIEQMINAMKALQKGALNEYSHAG